MYIFKGYSPAERRVIHDWLRKVHVSGFTGMVPKRVRPSPPDVQGEWIHIPEE
jgi:hypothetical protein